MTDEHKPKIRMVTLNKKKLTRSCATEGEEDAFCGDNNTIPCSCDPYQSPTCDEVLFCGDNDED